MKIKKTTLGKFEGTFKCSLFCFFFFIYGLCKSNIFDFGKLLQTVVFVGSPQKKKAVGNIKVFFNELSLCKYDGERTIKRNWKLGSMTTSITHNTTHKKKHFLMTKPADFHNKEAFAYCGKILN